MWETWVLSLGWGDPLEKGNTPVFWPGEFHGWYGPWGHTELDMTEQLSVFFFSFPEVIQDTSVQFSSVQSLNRVWFFSTPWIAARQASLSITNSRNLLKLMSIESVMPSSHLILWRSLLLLPPIPPNIRVFSNESALLMRWPKYWSFSFSISPSNEYPGLISFRMNWLDLLFKTHSRY